MSLLDSIDNAGDRGREFLQGMTPRDRALAALMATVLLLIGAFFGLSTMNSAKGRARTGIADATKAEAQVNLLAAELGEINEEVAALDAQLAAGEGISPATWMEKVGKELQISEKIKGINEKGSSETDFYRRQTVDVIVDDVDLDLIVTLTHRVETAEAAIRIDEMRVKTDRKDRSKLSLRMTISVLKPLGSAG